MKRLVIVRFFLKSGNQTDEMLAKHEDIYSIREKFQQGGAGIRSFSFCEPNADDVDLRQTFDIDLIQIEAMSIRWSDKEATAMPAFAVAEVSVN